MAKLDRGQRIAVLTGMAFAFYVFGHTLIGVVFFGGFVVYSPVEGGGIDWTYTWQSAVQLGIWLVLTAAWVVIAVRSLRGVRTPGEEPDESYRH